MADAVRERIRVLRVIGRLNVGGPAIHTTLLTDRLDSARFETLLIAGQVEASEGDYLQLQGRSVARLQTIPELGREIRGPRDVVALRKLMEAIRGFQPQIVHTHTAKAGTLGRIAAWVCRVPIIVHTYHGHVLRGYFGWAKTRVFVHIERALARVSDRLVAVSEGVRRDLLSMKIGDPRRFFVVPLGFDLDRFADVDHVRGRLRAELGVAPGVPLVGIVARLVPIKAHEVFFDAAKRVAETHPAHFVVVGDGERRAELERDVTAKGLRDRVHFLGWRRDLEQIYADLDVVALTSRNEGSPVALIEAMAAGVRVVSTNVGGVSDVVTDGETGRLVAAGDDVGLARAMTAVLDLASVERRLPVRAQEQVRARYGARRLVTQVESLYDALLDEKRLR